MRPVPAYPSRRMSAASDGWIGKPLRRFEDRRLLLGGGQYVEDVRIDDVLSVAVFRSPYAHARLVRIDVSAARQVPGVVDVIAGADVRGLGDVEVAPFVPNVLKPEHPLLVHDVARFIGEPVAAVLADSTAHA